ncbi:hypothetical protein Scep_025979 [Stephania cephalantha]|uniref:PIG-P domain-containing protein n=1 Tax=Stephania cephalantha TaxID=152367 RepID=A0AAP0EJ87_9MAGN
MGDPSCLNSPRRVLSLSKERERATIDKFSGFAVSKENSPKPSEVYGFVGSISTVVAIVLFLIWAYIPEPWLHSVGITYYPSRYWAFVVPTFAMVTVVLAIGFYIGLNFMVTPPPTSFNAMFDEYSREPTTFADTTTSDQPIEPLSDIGINKINDLMFNSAN